MREMTIIIFLCSHSVLSGYSVFNDYHRLDSAIKHSGYQNPQNQPNAQQNQIDENSFAPIRQPLVIPKQYLPTKYAPTKEELDTFDPKIYHRAKLNGNDILIDRRRVEDTKEKIESVPITKPSTVTGENYLATIENPSEELLRTYDRNIYTEANLNGKKILIDKKKLKKGENYRDQFKQYVVNDKAAEGQAFLATIEDPSEDQKANYDKGKYILIKISGKFLLMDVKEYQHKFVNPESLSRDSPDKQTEDQPKPPAKIPEDIVPNIENPSEELLRTYDRNLYVEVRIQGKPALMDRRKLEKRNPIESLSPKKAADTGQDLLPTIENPSNELMLNYDKKLYQLVRFGDKISLVDNRRYENISQQPIDVQPKTESKPEIKAPEIRFEIPQVSPEKKQIKIPESPKGQVLEKETKQSQVSEEYLPDVENLTRVQLNSYDKSLYTLVSINGKYALMDKRKLAAQKNKNEKPANDGFLPNIENPTKEQIKAYENTHYKLVMISDKYVLMDNRRLELYQKGQPNSQSPLPQQQPKSDDDLLPTIYDYVDDPSKPFDNTKYAKVIINGKLALMDKRKLKQVKKESAEKGPESQTTGLADYIYEFDPNNFDSSNYKIVQNQDGKQYLMRKALFEQLYSGQKGNQRNEVTKKRPEGSGDYTPALRNLLESENKTKGVALKNDIASGYPLTIHWEDTFLRATLKQLGRMELLKEIMDLVTRSEAFLRTFISVKAPPGSIRIPKGFKKCNTHNPSMGFLLSENHFPEAKTFEAHMVVFLYAFDNPKRATIAAAVTCTPKHNEGSPISLINFNLANMLIEDKMNNLRSKRMELTTMIHEILHTLSFHHDIMSNFRRTVDSKHPNLFKMKNLTTDPMMTDDHWSPEFFGFDMMNYIDRDNAILSIFSLEYISLANHNLETKKDVVASHFMQDSVSNWDDFFAYKCKDDEESAYPNWCSAKDRAKNRGSKCSQDFLYISVCGDDLFENNCYERKPFQLAMCSDDYQSDVQGSYGFYGKNSRCFEGFDDKSPSCQRFDINDSGEIIVGELDQGQGVCKSSADRFELKAIQGEYLTRFYIQCPDLNHFKKTLETSSCDQECHLNGICISGKCHCYEGYTPEDNCKSRLLSAYGSRFGTSYPIPDL